MNGTAALLIFEFRSGVRLAIRSFAPLFCAFLVGIMIQMYPAAFVRELARLAFARNPGLDAAMLLVLLAFLLPAWAAPRLAPGVSGWLRQLPLSEKSRIMGLAAGLITVQIPLLASLTILGFVAHGAGHGIILPSLRWILVCAAGAIAALPVLRGFPRVTACLCAAALALFGGLAGAGAAALLLAASVLAAGRIRKPRRHGRLRALEHFFDARIAWRALGWRTPRAFLPALGVWGAALLFIGNNGLTGRLEQAAARFGGILSIAVVAVALADRLTVRRPPWPWARSLPWSAARRVSSDAVFLVLHGLPLLLLQAISYPAAAASIVAVLPLLGLRAVSWMRRSQGLRAASVAFLAEGFALAALAALVPLLVLLMPILALPAFLAALEADRAQKVTRWLELHHASAGDSQSWGEQ